jgi:ADP-ribose pyrophosphatase YjhB (NUDIX family)
MEKAFIDKLAYIYLEDDRVLMSLSQGKDTWYIPGGKREGSESDEQALTREVKEELDVDIIPETIEPYGVFEAQAHGKPAGTIVCMTCYMADFTGDLKAASEIEKIDFFSYAQRDLAAPVDLLIFDDLQTKDLLK